MQSSFTSERASTRRGAIAILAVMLLVLAFAFAAFTIDIGLITVVKSELQTAADAAALAAATELSDRYISQSAATTATASTSPTPETKARAAAVELAYANPSASDTSTHLDPTADVRFGQYSWNTTSGAWTTTWGTQPYNAVEVTVRKSQARGNALPLTFAAVIGHRQSNIEETATAAILPAVGIGSPGCIPVPLLPIALDLDTWVATENGSGPDELSWNATSRSVAEAPDGTREIRIFPNGLNKSLPSGNRGTINFGGQSNSTAELIDQILNGVDCNDLALYGGSLNFSNGPVTMSGDPGISNAIKDALNTIVGQERMLLLYTNVSGTGATCQYTIVRAVGVRVMSVSLQGAMSHRSLIVQPTSFYHASAIPGRAPVTTYGTIYSAPRLVK